MPSHNEDTGVTKSIPQVCHFALAIEYQDPREVLASIRLTMKDLPQEAASAGPLDNVTTYIHSMRTACDPSLAIPHFQDIVIADVVKTFGECVEADPMVQATRGCEGHAQHAASLFNAVINSVVITLFAKHATLGLCALSEINLQLNALGHLSAWNPDNHAELLQIRAETFCAYFYQKRYQPFKIIALVSAGSQGVPLTAPISPLHAISTSEECEEIVSDEVSYHDLDHTNRNDSCPSMPERTTSTPVNERASDVHLCVTTPHFDAAHSPAPISPSIVKVREKDPCATMPMLVATETTSSNDNARKGRHCEKKDMKHVGSSRQSPAMSDAMSTPQQQSSGFSRFGRDLSPETFARVCDRTLSILGLGDVAEHRDILMRICCGTAPLFVRAAGAEFSQSRESAPTRSFRDERGVVVVPGKVKDSVLKEDDCESFSVPDALSGLLRVYVNDSTKINAFQYDAEKAADRAQYTHSTTPQGVAVGRRNAMRHWNPRKVVALHTRPSPSGAAVVVVEFSRKQEANDFRRYLSSFQKYSFLSVFKIQAARQLISDAAQFIPPNVDPRDVEMLIHPEEVTVDSLLSLSVSVPASLPLRTPATVRSSRAPESPEVVALDRAAEDGIVPVCLELVDGACYEAARQPRGKCSADDPIASLTLLDILGRVASPVFNKFIGGPLLNCTTIGIPHLGGPSRKVGAPANDAIDFVSLESFLMRLQSEVLGSAQIKNPTGLVSTLDKLVADANALVAELVQAALAIPNDPVFVQHRALMAEKKHLIALEGSLLALSLHLSPLVVYTRTLLCDMGACHARTLGRLNRGIVRQCIAKSTSLTEGIISHEMEASRSEAKHSQRETLFHQFRVDVDIANVLLEMALLFATVAAQWDALFDKAAFYNSGGHSTDPQGQRYTIRSDVDKQNMDTKPLRDQSLRLIQAAVARLRTIIGKQGAEAALSTEADFTRTLLLVIRQRSQYYSFYSSNRAHWPLSMCWRASDTDDYQSLSFVAFLTLR